MKKWGRHIFEIRLIIGNYHENRSKYCLSAARNVCAPQNCGSRMTTMTTTRMKMPMRQMMLNRQTACMRVSVNSSHDNCTYHNHKYLCKVNGKQRLFLFYVNLQVAFGGGVHLYSGKYSTQKLRYNWFWKPDKQKSLRLRGFPFPSMEAYGRKSLSIATRDQHYVLSGVKAIEDGLKGSNELNKKEVLINLNHYCILIVHRESVSTIDDIHHACLMDPSILSSIFPNISSSFWGLFRLSQ